MSLTITVRSGEEAATIIDVNGRVTLEDAPEFITALMSVVKRRKPGRVVVNMSQASYIDSAGIAGLVEALKVARDSNIGFALFGLSPVAREAFKLTRLISVFEVYDTEEEALRGHRSAITGPAD